MSSHDGPDEFATRRVPRPDAPPPGDPTRPVGDDLPPDATQQIDPAVNERTRAAGAASREPLSYEQPWPAEPASTTSGYDRPDPEADAAAAEAERIAEEERRERRKRDLLLGLVGALVGFLLAFVIVALSTDDGEGGEVVAADERVGALESDLGERDARIEELEAQLAEAEAAAGDRDEDVAAQQQALDERSAALDERNEQADQRGERLDERERALNEREQQLDQREQAIEQRESESGDAPAEGDPPADGDGGGVNLPDLPDVPSGEEVDNFVESVLDRIRNLFGG
ncbi:MAG TPA: hypothetical protein VK906_11330 [Egicoccus sp.]|nr:hypothetical protein [Egicoccus sp.]HSK23763.1 hypothetical protein [Egicoccus sp.]